MRHDYKEAFRKGHEGNVYIADLLTKYGVPAKASEHFIAETSQEIEDAKYVDKDVVLSRSMKCLEVKGRNLSFTRDPATFPFPTIFIDTVSGWEAKIEKPLAVVCFSLKTRDAIVIPVSTKQHWRKKVGPDHVRNIEDEFYTVAREHCRTFSELIEHLKKYNA